MCNSRLRSYFSFSQQPRYLATIALGTGVLSEQEGSGWANAEKFTFGMVKSHSILGAVLLYAVEDGL